MGRLDSRANDAFAQFMLAGMMWQVGDLEDALPRARRATQLEPGNATYHNFLGDIHRGLGNLDHARESFQEAIQLMQQKLTMFEVEGASNNASRVWSGQASPRILTHVWVEPCGGGAGGEGWCVYRAADLIIRCALGFLA